MKKLHLPLIVLFLIINKSVSQEKFDLNQIEKEFTLENISLIKKDFVMTYSHIEKIAISRSYLSDITDIDRKYFTTSMYFYNIDFRKNGFYINDKNFDYKGFREIIPIDHEDLRINVIISTDIYKTDEKIIFLINDIQLIK